MLDNKAIARYFLEEGFSTGNLTPADELIAANFTNHDPSTPPLPTGPEGYKQLVTMYRTAYPDLKLTVEDLIVEGNKVVGRWTARGTNTGQLMGMPSTGKQATIPGISILSIINGKVVEQRTNWDTLGMLQQLGIIPAPGQD
ncbi:MAG: ester cyclase [Chloroflexi bacterium]|nr:ester cyclase [Chloroflexota bacterium]